MQVIVTKHAIKRFRERVFQYSSSDKEIYKNLKEIAVRGKFIRNRFSRQRVCLEIRYRGISIVAIEKDNCLIIVTCLGEASYRRWVKVNETNLLLDVRYIDKALAL